MNKIKYSFRSPEGFCFRHFLTTTSEMASEIHNVSHCHPQLEIYYFAQGKIRFTINEKVFSLEEGDVIVIQGQNHHSIQVDPNYDYERYCIEISEKFLLSLCGHAPLLNNFNTAVHGLHINHGQKTSKILHELKELEKLCLKENVPYKDHIVLAEIIKIAADISNMYEKKNKSDKKQLLDNKNEDNITKAFDYINRHLDKALTVDEICKEACLSRSYFQHIFKKYTKLSLSSYIMRQKMYTAKYLLENGTSLTETASLLGYKYYSLFSNHYKKFFGRSPKNH